ncbi:MAG: membrane protein insertase YidC [Alphaproteobacteria bacterium]|nr:membrane protein insertase YidC [Alphaproteobacteria bacterium]
MQNPKQFKSEERNLFVALILIIFVLMGFQTFTRPKVENTVAPEQTQVAEQVVETKPVQVVQPTLPVVEKALEQATFAVQNDFVSGKITADGLTINDWTLTQYKETLAEDSPDVQLLSDKYGLDVYWTVAGQKIPLILQEGETLTPNTPLVFGAKSRDLTLKRTISLDDHYMLTFVDEISNTSAQPISATLQGQIYRSKDTISEQRSVVHTGFVSMADNRLQENDYPTIDEETISYQSKNTWLGLTDKYWQTILIPQADDQVKITNAFDNDAYRASFEGNSLTLASGQTITRTTRVFAGAKDLNLINDYMQLYNIPKFELSIDFGWFYFLTKPFLYFLQWLNAFVGNMGIAILLFATLLRLLLLPVATKSYVSMAQMKKIQPQLQSIQQRYKDDRLRMQQEVMALYKREKVNPAGGCLPMLIQIPVFFALYKVLSVSLQMRQAPFFWWIKDLSAPDSSSVFTLFGLIPWPIPSFLNLGVMPILMGLTMYIQQKMTPQTAGMDKAQMNMFKWMPVIFTFMMGQFAVGLIIYWTWSNILSIMQQRYIMKKVK